MTSVTIIHNPRCSKSRQTLALLQDQDCDVTVIEYLKTPLSATDIAVIQRKLNVPVRAMMRVKDTEYKLQNLGDENVSDEQLIQAMVHHPALIERPIVLANEKAAIGRPPENVLAIL